MRLKFIACKYTLFIQDGKSYESFFRRKWVLDVEEGAKNHSPPLPTRQTTKMSAI